MPLTSGEILHNRYRIVKLLGQGGFGAVYRGWDLNLQRPCAIKENLETGLESREQFEREARMLSNLTHPNLPRVTDYFFISGQGQYLVMDFIEGDDLQDKLDHAAGPLPEAQVLPWIEQVSEALNYLHTQNPPIIHRDIKPKNLIIRPDGQAFIVDFGIAKLHDPQKRTTLGARAVTTGYSPPEQYGAGATDARSDVYSLGATLYTLLTNSVPPESISRQMGTPLPPARSLNPQITHNTERALHTALELQPDLRFQNVREFSNNLYSLVEFQRSAKPQVFPSVIPAQTVKTPPRSRKSWYIGGIIAVMTACLIPILLYINFSSQIKSFFLPVTPSPTNTPTSLVLSLPTQSNTTHTPSPTTEQPISTNTPTPPTHTKTLTLTSTQTETPTPTPTLPYGGGGLVAFNSNRTGNNPYGQQRDFYN
jgi:serine/threonine protein kinase